MMVGEGQVGPITKNEKTKTKTKTKAKTRLAAAILLFIGKVIIT